MELFPNEVQNSGKKKDSVMRGQRFPVVNITIKYEIAVCPFSCDRAENEDIFLSSITKRNILCVATFLRCLKCNLSPFMNFGLHTSRHSNGKMPYTLSS